MQCSALIVVQQVQRSGTSMVHIQVEWSGPQRKGMEREYMLIDAFDPKRLSVMCVWAKTFSVVRAMKVFVSKNFQCRSCYESFCKVQWLASQKRLWCGPMESCMLCTYVVLLFYGTSWKLSEVLSAAWSKTPPTHPFCFCFIKAGAMFKPRAM